MPLLFSAIGTAFAGSPYVITFPNTKALASRPNALLTKTWPASASNMRKGTLAAWMRAPEFITGAYYPF